MIAQNIQKCQKNCHNQNQPSSPSNQVSNKRTYEEHLLLLNSEVKLKAQQSKKVHIQILKGLVSGKRRHNEENGIQGSETKNKQFESQISQQEEFIKFQQKIIQVEFQQSCLQLVSQGILFSQSSSQQSQQNLCEQTQPTTTSTRPPTLIPFEKTQTQLYIQHLNHLDLIRQWKVTQYHQAFPWISSQTKKIKNTELRFHNEVLEFYQYVKPTNTQHQRRMKVFQEVRMLVTQRYPQADVRAFGSFATRLYLPDGDIDIVVLIGQQQAHHFKQSKDDLRQRRKTNQTYYLQIFKLLKHHKSFRQVRYVSSASTPILKLLHYPSGIPLDICFNNELGLRQIPICLSLVSTYPQLGPLLLIFKCHLSLIHLNSTFHGGIGSFLLYCMIYYFLYKMHDGQQYYLLSELVMKFMAYWFMDVDWNKTTIKIKDCTHTKRNRRANTISVLSPLDQQDIGIKAYRVMDVFYAWKSRYILIRQKHFKQAQSIIKEFVNPNTQEFVYYAYKQQHRRLDRQQLRLRQLLEQRQTQKMQQACSQQQLTQNHTQQQNHQQQKLSQDNQKTKPNIIQLQQQTQEQNLQQDDKIYTTFMKSQKYLIRERKIQTPLINKFIKYKQFKRNREHKSESNIENQSAQSIQY